MTAKTDAGRKLLRAAEDILANPQHFNMDLFTDLVGERVDGTCGTTACIAGWVALRAKRFKVLDNFIALYEPDNVCGIAREALDLRGDLWDQLVYRENWKNERLSYRYDTAKTQKARAKAGADYIHWFVKKYKL